MGSQENSGGKAGISRRDFLLGSAAVGAGVMLSRWASAEDAPKPTGNDLKVGIVGVGTEGRVLLDQCLKIPGIRFVAVCDIWPYYRDYTVRLLKRYKMEPKPYTDYEEMLAAEKDMDAVIVATPDWVHSPISVACLKAGKHVYCEKEMANTIEGARAMVLAARESKKLLQIGHQRRSNPRYHKAHELITKQKACGLLTNVEAHWNRYRRLNVGFPKGADLDEATLKKYGYDTMEHFRNWRWYKKFGAGAIADLGSHQIDIFHWFIGAMPRAVMASGGVDYPAYQKEGIEWYDNVNAIYEWQREADGKKQIVRGFYQTLSTTSHGGYVETFMGDEGSLVIGEDPSKGGLRREKEAPEADWEKTLTPVGGEAPKEEKKEAKKEEKKEEEGITLKHSVPAPGRYYQAIAAKGEDKPVHMWHLENFFDAVRKGTPLNCPAEIGFETAVSILRVNEAVESTKRIEFKPEEFKA
jgi:predicted dehydrogenase